MVRRGTEQPLPGKRPQGVHVTMTKYMEICDADGMCFYGDKYFSRGTGS